MKYDCATLMAMSDDELFAIWGNRRLVPFVRKMLAIVEKIGGAKRTTVDDRLDVIVRTKQGEREGVREGIR